MSTMIGYARVSTAEQNLKMQEDALKRAGCYRIFTDVISGAKDKRPGLDDALAFLREGDNPYIKRLDMFIARRSSVQLDELARLRGCTKRQLVEDLLEQAWQAAKVAMRSCRVWMIFRKPRNPVTLRFNTGNPQEDV